MAKKPSRPGQVHLRIVEIMKRFPQGISGGQIREELEKQGLKSGDQTHLDRRKRDLKKWFEIGKTYAQLEVDGVSRRVILYSYVGEKLHVSDEGDIGIKLRAAVIHAAHQRCQMCGRTVEKHGVALVVDHKVPREWGGSNDKENLWGICEECNSGKKAHFSSLNLEASMMASVMTHKSVHVRIGELLKAFGIGNPVPAYLIEIVSGNNQDDWEKRLRELRYPPIGWEFDFKRKKEKSGKSQVTYILRKHVPWPLDPSGTIRKFEKEREAQNRLLRK
jgi:5-methylcytosine-specific restriction endonuclease McrA